MPGPVAVAVVLLAAQAPPTPTAAWTCPVHREVLEQGAGACPVCQRDLVETRVQPAWTCPLHPVILEAAAGRCRICARDLIAVTVEVGWTCPMHAEVQALEPGACPICKMALVEQSTARPHEDHTPKHGGIFFMAPDNWHHLEGTYPEPGVFRLFFYDNYSQPLDARSFSGRAVTGEVYDEARGETRELAAYPLFVEADGAYLEARVPEGAFPAEITAKVRFKPDGPEERFDFIFAEHSSDAAPATTPAAPADFRALANPIPERPNDIAFEISVRDLRIQDLVRQGAFGEIFLPALEAKDLALALDGHLPQLAGRQQETTRLAIKRLVRAAWLLDWYGDLGNRERVTEAYRLFASAVTEIKSVYAVP